MFNAIYHRHIYIFGILILIFGLSLSPFLISLGQFILAGNWLLSFRFKEKWSQIINRESLLFILTFYLVHVIWLFNTSNINYALNDLKIKIPLFALPIIFSSAQPLSTKELKFILHMFILSILISTGVSTYIFLGFSKFPPYDAREASIFISHIRFAILVTISIYILLTIILNEPYQYKPIYKTYILILTWLFLFLFTVSSLTGLALLLSSIPFVYFFWAKPRPKNLWKYISHLGMIAFLAGILIYVWFSYQKFSKRNEVDFAQLETYTQNGNRYTHKDKNYYENKDLIWIYVCDQELQSEWNKRSEIKINEIDKKGQLIRYTLTRYLTSLGERKDSVGVWNLSEKDVKYIELGYTNHIFKKKLSLYPRIFQVFWELERYFNTGNPNGYSISMRIEYLKTACSAIKENFWFGTGTGDVNDVMLDQYKTNNTILKEKWWYRPHNQIATSFLTFGLLGFSLIIICMGFGLWKSRKNIDTLTFAFLILIFFSLLAEDTLETQAGASITAFFLSLLILGRTPLSGYEKKN